MIPLSIITVNLNNLEGLKKTMTSVFEQTFDVYEYIVIDGGSTDGSKEYIEQHAGKLAYWVSEPDKGIYHAMNKALAKAAGRYLLFLNSGDYLIDSKILQDTDINDFTADIVYGNIVIKEEGRQWTKKYPGMLAFDYFTKDTLPHSGGAFIKRELFERVGGYNEDFKILADWEFYMKALFRYNCSYLYIDKTISVFDYTGISSQKENKELFNNELKKILEGEFKTLHKMNKELNEVKHKHQLLMNSRFVKTYLKVKSFFP